MKNKASEKLSSRNKKPVCHSNVSIHNTLTLEISCFCLELRHVSFIYDDDKKSKEINNFHVARYFVTA